MTRRELLATVGLFIATIAVIVGAWLLFNHKPNTSGYIVDRDTGEVYDTTVNNFETGGNGDSTSNVSSAQLFGIEKFINTATDHGYVHTDFATDVRNAISTFSLKNLHDIYSSITLRPQNMVFTDGDISAQLRLGQDDTIIPNDNKVVGDGSAALITIDGGKEHGGTFVYVGGLTTLDQTLYTISQTDYSGPDLTVDSFTYREAALNSLEKLGYDIPGLNIKFTNYQDPFQ